MTKQRSGPPKPTPIRPRRTDADIEALLDRLDDALIAGDPRSQQLAADVWKLRRGMPKRLTERIITGRAKVPAFAFEMLSGFAGDDAPIYLQQIAADPRAHSVVRFGARRRAGWDEEGEAVERLAFLASLADPAGTLVEAIRQGSHLPLADGEILSEVMGYLTMMPAGDAVAIVADAAHQIGMPVSPLLRALLHVPVPALQRLALAELTRLRDSGAAGALLRFARTTADKTMRAEAEAAAQRVRLQVVDRDAHAEPVELPPVERAFVSIVDGDGGQALVVVRAYAEGAYLFVNFFANEQSGLKDVYGVLRASDENLELMTTEFQAGGIELIEVDIAAVRGAIARAIEINQASQQPLSPAFEFWEPLLHDQHPPAADEPSIVPELDDEPYAGRKDLIRAGGALADHPWFDSWGFEPERTSVAMASTPPPARGRWTARQYQPLIEQLVDAGMRTQLRGRLRRQAWLLEQSGDEEARDHALALAHSITTAKSTDLARHGLLQVMAERSVTMLVATVLYGDILDEAGGPLLEDFGDDQPD